MRSAQKGRLGTNQECMWHVLRTCWFHSTGRNARYVCMYHITVCMCVCVCVRVCVLSVYARARAHTHTHTHTHIARGTLLHGAVGEMPACSALFPCIMPVYCIYRKSQARKSSSFLRGRVPFIRKRSFFLPRLCYLRGKRASSSRGQRILRGDGTQTWGLDEAQTKRLESDLNLEERERHHYWPPNPRPITLKENRLNTDSS